MIAYLANKTQFREWAESLGAKVTEMDLESQLPSKAQFN
jgi:hypothetical protein